MQEPMTTRFGLVLDCVDAERLAEFWTVTLGYVNAGRAGSYRALPAER